MFCLNIYYISKVYSAVRSELLDKTIIDVRPTHLFSQTPPSLILCSTSKLFAGFYVEISFITVYIRSYSLTLLYVKLKKNTEKNVKQMFARFPQLNILIQQGNNPCIVIKVDEFCFWPIYLPYRFCDLSGNKLVYGFVETNQCMVLA